MSRLHRLDSGLAWLERTSVVVLLLSLLMLGLVQVVLRNVFASGLFWADEVLRHLVLWIGFIGASLATHEQRHLRMDVLAQWLPHRYQVWINLLTNLLAMVGCALLSHAAYTYVTYEYAAETTLSIHLPIWVAQIILPVGFACMALRFALRAYDRLGQFQMQKDAM
jgi:TRAP-type C4-dicarboxylate transport system permease small subunit